MSLPLEVLQLDARAYSCLYYNGCRTVGGTPFLYGFVEKNVLYAYKVCKEFDLEVYSIK